MPSIKSVILPASATALPGLSTQSTQTHPPRVGAAFRAALAAPAPMAPTGNETRNAMIRSQAGASGVAPVRPGSIRRGSVGPRSGHK